MTTLLVTVRGPAGTVDLGVPGDVPALELVPGLRALVGGRQQAEAWTLVPDEGIPLADDQTLAAAGVVDGQVLLLVPAVAAPAVGDGQRQAALPPRPQRGVLPGPAGPLARAGLVVRALVAPGRAGLPTVPRGRPWSERPALRSPEPRRRLGLRERTSLAWRSTGRPQRIDEAVAQVAGGPRCASIAVVSAGDGRAATRVAELVAGVAWELRGGRVAAAELDLQTGALIPCAFDVVGVDAAASLAQSLRRLAALQEGADVLVVGVRGPLDLPAAAAVLAAFDQVVLVVEPESDPPESTARAAQALAAQGLPPHVLIAGRGSHPSNDTLASYARALPEARSLSGADRSAPPGGGRSHGPRWTRELAATLAADWPALGVGGGAALEVAG